MAVKSDQFTGVDLSRLPFPGVIETLDFAALRAEWLAAFQTFFPEFDATLESDPIVKICELGAYREMIWRQRANSAAMAIMPAYAVGADLDAIAALFAVERFILTEANPALGIEEVLEPDEDFRRRVVLAPEGFSVAGPVGAYLFHALSADGDVLDASAVSPTPGDVVITVLSRSNGGVATPELLATVEATLSADTVRPLTDQVTVQAAAIIDYDIEATLTYFTGPDRTVVEAASRNDLDSYIAVSRRLGRAITRAGIIGALMTEGVQNVDLVSPAADVEPTAAEAANCASITLYDGGTV